MAKKTKKEDLHSQSAIELTKLLKQAQLDLIKMKLDLKMDKLKNTQAVKKKRRAIARIKTIIKEKELT